MDISAIGRQFGLDEAQTRAALEALTPVVAAGVRRSAQSPEGLQDILKSVLTGGFGGALANPEAVQFDRAKPVGDDILGQIFGSPDVSRGVAQQLSATSGIGAAVLKKLLPIVATIVMGQLAKNMGAGAAPASPGGGGLGDILKDILGGGSGGGMTQRVPQQPSAPGGGLGDILKDVFGGGAAQEPAPAPQGGGQGGSLEDILGEILKGGNGRVVMKQVPPDQMGEILKEIFGGGAGGGSRPNPDAVTRGRKTIDDALGGGGSSGNAADILLDSVDKAVRRR